MSQSRSERMEWSAIRDYLATTEKRAQSAELRLGQVRELLIQSEDMTYEDFLDELKGILE